MYQAYSSWCRDVGEDAVTRRAFNGRMRGHGFVDKDAKDAGSTLKCWMDLTLGGPTDE